MPPDTLRRWSLADVDGLFADVETAPVVVEPERPGPGSWAGAPSAVADDGAVFLAYRLRRPVGQGRGYATWWPAPRTARTSRPSRCCTATASAAKASSGPAWYAHLTVAGGSTSASRPPAASTGGSTCSRPTSRPGWEPPTPPRCCPVTTGSRSRTPSCASSTAPGTPGPHGIRSTTRTRP